MKTRENSNIRAIAIIPILKSQATDWEVGKWGSGEVGILVDNNQAIDMRKNSRSYRHSSHCLGLATVHLCWIPKRRKPVLIGKIRNRLAEIINQVAADKGWFVRYERNCSRPGSFISRI